MAAGAIALVEPQSEGMVHAPFNAALLHTVAIAYPGMRLCFHSLTLHGEQVQAILNEVAPEVSSRIHWVTFPAAKSTAVVARWSFHRRLFQQLLAPGQRTLFCSISRMQLLQLMRLVRRTQAGQVRVVLHGELEQLEREQNSWLRPLSLGRILSRKPTALRYLLLGRSIRDNIPPSCASAFADAGVCDHPYHFAVPRTATPGEVILGVFGNAGEAQELEAVARKVKNACPSIRIRLVGFVSGPSIVDRLRALVEDVAATPLTRNVFSARAQGITHALWLAPPQSFRLRASGTFFDALSYAKPLVYTANPFIDAYHAMDPSIGVRCSTLDDVVSSILELADDGHSGEYDRAQAAILRLRERFTPAALASALRRALDWG